MVTSIDIEALFNSLGGTKAEWDLLEVPIPKKLLVYAIDTGDFKLGDGTNKYRELPIIFNVENMIGVTSLYESFPSLDQAQPGKFVLVNSAGDGYVLSDLTISQLVTTAFLTNELKKKALATHSHNVRDVSGMGSCGKRDTGTEPGDVPIIQDTGKLDPAIVPTVTGETLDNDNLMSWMLLNQMVELDMTAITLKNDHMDEFEDETGIDTSNNATYDALGFYQGTNMMLKSKAIDITTNPLSVGMFVRAEVQNPINSNMLIDISLDDGTSWTSVALKESPLTTGSIRVFSGFADTTNATKTKKLRYRIQGGSTLLKIHGLHTKW